MLINFIDRVLIEKAGHDNGFENVQPSSDERVILSSARHRAVATISKTDNQFLLDITSTVSPQQQHKLLAVNIAELAVFLKQAAKLAQTTQNFAQQIQEEQAKYASNGIKDTEIERLVKQRIGQNIFRNALLDYWGGACAVTGINIPDILRASHAKSWKDCDSDAERLDVFNGFLLNDNLDALFDRHLISFDQHGKILISPQLNQQQCQLLGLHPDLCLRWLANQHQPYLNYHRALFEQNNG